MAKKSAEKVSKSVNPKGQKFGNIICERFIRLGDAMLIIDKHGNALLYEEKNSDSDLKKYKIDGQKVDDVFYADNLKLFILRVGNKYHFRDSDNRTIQGSEGWADFYLEEFTSSFFRKDSRGNWYDIQGNMLRTHFFIKDQVLCSINGKTSKKSLYFKDQSLYINPKSTMVQVGKIVYDLNLNVLQYFGEKITGLGSSNIEFGVSKSIQEVYLGLSKRAFIDDITYEPFTIQGEEIITHRSTVEKGSYTLEIMQSENTEFVICNDLDHVLFYDNNPLSVDFESFITLGSYDLIKVSQQESQFYLDLKTMLPFDPLKNGALVNSIDSNTIKLQNRRLYNCSSEEGQFVYDITNENIFTIGKESIAPEQISPVQGFEKHFFYTIVEGSNKLCDIQSNEILKFEDESIEISKVLGRSEDKLLNVRSTDNRPFVLDARFGMEKLKIAKVGIYRIVETVGKPVSLGNFILQNIKIQTLGGSERRVVNLNDPDLTFFHLPDDLKAYSEQSTISIFAGNIITHIDFERSIGIENEYFYNATFLSYLNESEHVIIQKTNAKPLQLDGLGHRHELIQSFDFATIKKNYYLSEHRIIGANTLTEELKKNQLLFSFNTKSSWLPFYDTYLPIFKKIIDFESFQHWEYHLFELRNISNTKEYVAVEQNKPYRILVDKSRSKYRPRIVKSKEIVLKSPEEISSIRRFFSNPGFLVEVG